MKRRDPALALTLLVVSVACAHAPIAADQTVVQETASLMVSIGQHGEGLDFAESAGQLDQQVAKAPDDPFVLKLAAIARTSLASEAQDRALRHKLLDEALAQVDRAISLAWPETAIRVVRMNGQETEVDLKDLPDLRAQLLEAVQADR